MPLRRPNPRRGYVLILTIGLLAIAATLLVSVGRASLRHAVEARDAVDRLQRRVGVMSCRNVILPHAQDILIRQEQRTKMSVPSLRTSLRLGGQRFELIIADEQAKANVNALLERSDRDTAASRLRELLEPTGVARFLRLRGDGAVGSIGDLFDGTSIESLLGRRGTDTPAALDIVTCWGNGSLNVRRAPERVLRVASNPPLGPNELAQLLQLRQNRLRGIRSVTGTPGTAADPISRLFSQSTGPDGGAVGGLTNGSSCHSLWVIVKDGRRAWEHLDVRDESDPQHARSWSFVW